jgi:hypothetical protein
VFESKFLPWSTIKDHYATLVDQNDPDSRAYLPDYVVLIGVPVAAGAAVGCSFKLHDMQSYIGGVAIFTGLLFGLVIYVFQLRMQLLSDPNVPRDGKLASFIDQVFANVNYAVVVGVIATIASMAAAVTADDDGRINAIWSGVVIALGVHLMLVVFMCIKRIRAAYREIKKLPRNTHI